MQLSDQVQPSQPVSRGINPDLIALLFLAAVWLVFFWRFFTPSALDQVSYSAETDFAGQFVTFAQYQADRLSAGDLPLWNPFNNGGFPFIADTQAAALYPPRLLTIAVLNTMDGTIYSALQAEVALHVLLYTVMAYAYVRRLTLGMSGSAIGAVAAALTIGYGGWLTSYPPLQVALLEAATWLPLVLLALLETTRSTKIRWPWLSLAGLALGLSWLAGHPQTSWYITYLSVAYLAYRSWLARISFRHFSAMVIVYGAITAGIAAIHLLPGLEYLGQTMRDNLSFAEKGSGLVFNDLSTLLYPRVFWSPLYFGIIGLGLAGVALQGHHRERLFWVAAALVGLLLSFGANSAAFHALYNLLPGLSQFRGQERAAFIVANSAAILVGLGLVTLAQRPDEETASRIRFAWRAYAGVTALIAAAVYVLWFSNPTNYDFIIDQAFLTAVLATASLLVISRALSADRPALHAALIGLIAFELLSVNIPSDDLQAVAASDQPILQPSALVQMVQADEDPTLRVDGGMVAGRIGIPPGGNTGSLYAIGDIRGISPLFLDGPHALIQRESPAPVAWEVFAVKYVFSDQPALNVASEIIGEAVFADAPLYLHQLADPRPFAHLVTRYEVVPNDAAARQRLANPDFDARATVLLQQEPGLDLTQDLPADAMAWVTDYHPERFSIQAESNVNAILTIAHVDYSGWQARLDGEPVPTLRAYGGVTAVALPAGSHTLTFTYRPLSVIIGAAISLFTWAALGILALVLIGRAARQRRLVVSKEETKA